MDRTEPEGGAHVSQVVSVTESMLFNGLAVRKRHLNPALHLVQRWACFNTVPRSQEIRHDTVRVLYYQFLINRHNWVSC